MAKYKKSGRKLAKPRGGQRSYAAAKRRAAHGVGRAGHGECQVRRASADQMKYFKSHGYFNIQLNGKKRKVTRCNLKTSKGGRYYGFYKRSDTGKNALRNFCSDKKRTAAHSKPGNRRKPMVGD